MTIGIDVRMIMPFPTGIGNYRLSVLTAILQLDRKNKYFLIGNKEGVLAPENIARSVKEKIIPENFSDLYSKHRNVSYAKIKSPANHPFQHLFLPFELRKLKLDIFFTSPWGAALAIPCKFVMEIDDLLYHHFPEFGSFKYKLYEIFLEKTLAQNAAAIVTISAFVKNDIHKFLGIKNEKITNIKGSAADEYRQITDTNLINKVLNKHGLKEGGYFIYLGNQRPHKNLISLLKAFEMLKGQLQGFDENLNLALIGGVDAKGRDADSQRIANQLEKMIYKKNVHLLGKIFDQNEVAALLNKAIALVHPSLHEGFGMTPLEAMRCGCPVISSNSTAMPEIVGDAGILINPENIEDISEAMSSILNDENLHEKLSKKSLERAKMFSWEKTAMMLLNVFRGVKI